MRIFVKAKPNSKKEEIEKIDNTHFSVSVIDSPIRGKANKAVIKVLAKYFKVPRSAVEIISGHTVRNKIIVSIPPKLRLFFDEFLVTFRK